MQLSDFDFELPDAQIARHPLSQRDESRLLVLRRPSGRIAHHRFRDLPSLLTPGDLLVLNDARVFHARLLGQKAQTGGRVELLLVRPSGETRGADALAKAAGGQVWVCLGQASKGLRAGTELSFAPGLSARVTEERGEGEYRVVFVSDAPSPLGELLAQQGSLPLPPYLERPAETDDETRYQTVFARSTGSAAAPTAGLHFTPGVFQALEARGIERTSLTLDVGPGTFLPVRGSLETHRMHSERFHVPGETLQRIQAAREHGRRIVAAGTTVVRSLESLPEPLTPGDHESSLFIRPGFTFRFVEVLLTNFHLPRSTLLMLVSAFAGREAVLAAYREAVREGYRFFSYGDAMLVLPDQGAP